MELVGVLVEVGECDAWPEGWRVLVPDYWLEALPGGAEDD